MQNCKQAKVITFVSNRFLKQPSLKKFTTELTYLRHFSQGFKPSGNLHLYTYQKIPKGNISEQCHHRQSFQLEYEKETIMA